MTKYDLKSFHNFLITYIFSSFSMSLTFWKDQLTLFEFVLKMNSAVDHSLNVHLFHVKMLLVNYSRVYFYTREKPDANYGWRNMGNS